MQRVTQVSCGWRHTVALTDRGNIYSWGRGTSGQLGHGDAVDRNEPKRIELLSVDGLACWQIECSQPDNATGKPFNSLMAGNIWHCNSTFTNFSFIWGPKFKERKRKVCEVSGWGAAVHWIPPSTRYAIVPDKTLALYSRQQHQTADV
jgi:hypothetical protein